VLCVVR